MKPLLVDDLSWKSPWFTGEREATKRQVWAVEFDPQWEKLIWCPRHPMKHCLESIHLKPGDQVLLYIGNTLPTYGCSLLEFSHLRLIENAIPSLCTVTASRFLSSVLQWVMPWSQVNRSAAEVNKHDNSRTTPRTHGLSLSRISFWLKWTGFGEGWKPKKASTACLGSAGVWCISKTMSF